MREKATDRERYRVGRGKKEREGRERERREGVLRLQIYALIYTEYQEEDAPHDRDICTD